MTDLLERTGAETEPEVTPSGVPLRARPTGPRAAAAARLAGAEAGPEAVADRMRRAARRARTTASSRPPLSVPQGAPAPERSGSTGMAPPSGPGGPAIRANEVVAVHEVVAVGGAAALAVAVPAPRPDPVHEPAPRPRHLRVVPDGALSPAQRRRRARVLLIGGISGAAAIGLALVYFHVVLAQRQFALDRLNTQVQKAQATYQDRRLQVAQLGSPQHIISMAEGQLGMQQPAHVAYLSPAGGGSVQGGSSSLAPPSTAPAGDADWPQIKSQLAGIP